MNSRFLSICAIVCMLGLAGCATSTGRTERSANQVDRGAEQIGNAALGSRLTVDLSPGSSESTQQQEVVVLSEYSAASGELCRRFSIVQTNQVRLACRNSREMWSIKRSLIPQNRDFRSSTSFDVSDSIEELPVSSVTTDDETIADYEEVMVLASGPAFFDEVFEDLIVLPEESTASSVFEVSAGETLWRFSRRVTGTSLNWKPIAEFNAIVEPYLVRSGDVVEVPDELVRDELRNR